MPIIHVNMLSGRTREQKRKLARLMTDATVEALDCAPEAVRIMIHEVGADDFYNAGITLAERKAANGGANGSTNGAGIHLAPPAVNGHQNQ